MKNVTAALFVLASSATMMMNVVNSSNIGAESNYTDNTLTSPKPNDGLSEPMTIDPNTSIQYRLVNSQIGSLSSNKPDAIECVMTYTGSNGGWLALGINSAGRSMPGSQVVLGKPLEANVKGQNPAKYTINGYNAASITPYPSLQQTLINATIIQSNSSTTLRFIKLLKEEGEDEIFPNSVNDFVFAIGLSSSFPSMYQSGQQYFQLNPSSSVVKPITKANTGRNSKTIFIAHGIIALIAWAVLAPLAAAASALRGLLLPASEGLWFQYHRGFNIMAVLFTFVAFVIAVAYQGPGLQSNDPHFVAGWVIFFACFLQAVMGIIRPPVQPDDIKVGGLKSWLQQVLTKSSIRAYWELLHKTLGWSLIGVTMWQMYTGLVLLTELFQTPKYYINAYWSYMIIFWTLFVIGCIFSAVCKQPKYGSNGKENITTSAEQKEDDEGQDV